MFIGHYGPALAGKAIARSVPLWALFFAVQFVDVLFGVFLANGIEHMRIVPGFTEGSPFDLYHMPWTHSLSAALFWAVLAGFVYALLAREQKRLGGLAIGIAVFSHWVTDLLVHVPDLPLWPGGPKVGLGLWNNYAISLSLEVILVLGGLALYMSVTRAKGLIGRIWPFVLLALLGVAEYVNHTGPLPTETVVQGYFMAFIFLVFTALAAVCDLTREAK